MKTKKRKGVTNMKKLAIAFAMILGLNMISSMIHLSTPTSYAQENPEPEPEEPSQPDKE
jgi:hypothetical protein